MSRDITAKVGYEFEGEIVARRGRVSMKAGKEALEVVAAAVLTESRDIDKTHGVGACGNEVDHERHYLAECLQAVDRAMIAFEDARQARERRLALTVPGVPVTTPLDDDPSFG